VKDAGMPAGPLTAVCKLVGCERYTDADSLSR